MHKVLLVAVHGIACGLTMGLVLLVGGRIMRPSPAEAGEAVPTFTLLRAQRFDLVDAKGQVQSTWLVNKGDGGSVFVDEAGNPQQVVRAGKPLPSPQQAGGATSIPSDAARFLQHTWYRDFCADREHAILKQVYGMTDNKSFLRGVRDCLNGVSKDIISFNRAQNEDYGQGVLFVYNAFTTYLKERHNDQYKK